MTTPSDTGTLVSAPAGRELPAAAPWEETAPFDSGPLDRGSETWLAETGPPDIGLAETRLTETELAEMGLAETGLAETRLLELAATAVRRNRTEVPRPITLWIEISPPCSSTVSLLVGRPMRRPTRPFLGVKPKSKTSRKRCSGMPTPLSDKSTSMRSSCRRAWMRI